MTSTAIALTLCGLLFAAGASWAPPPAHAEPGTAETLSSLVAGLTRYADDEFDGPQDAPPDAALWNVETGAGGWGNHEQQTYTADSANVRLDGQGRLVIEASDVGGELTSSRINTDGKVELVDGLIAARIRMPQGQGLHPAFWMLGANLDQVGYPGSGEIDVVELVNSGSRAYFSVHGPMEDPNSPKWKSSKSIVAEDLSAAFHTYWLYKQPDRLVIGIDDTALATFEPTDVLPGGRWVQDLPFFALLNVAVAGEWPGPLGPGVLPARMLVDWVRWYR